MSGENTSSVAERRGRAFSTLPPIQVEEPLQDVIAEENSTATLAFKIGFKDFTDPLAIEWYKDGVLLPPSDRFTLHDDNGIYQLQISPVTINDYGIYHAALCEGNGLILGTAALNITSCRLHGGTVYSKPQRFRINSPARHAYHQCVDKGSTVQLDLELQSSNGIEYLWYKSNKRIIENERTILSNTSKSSSLLILNAEDSDTGMYHVVATTALGIVSSFANVLVNMKTLTTDRVPFIEEPLPEEIDCTELDDIRLICRIKIDAQTTVRWTKNGIGIDDSDKFTIEDYGNGYVGLKITGIEQGDSAGYALMVRNTVLDINDSTSCFVNVSECYERPGSIANLSIPLRTILACVGSHVILKCSFNLHPFQYFYAVWQVGRYRVERTNHLFCVANYDGDYYLAIKRLAPDMGGLIRCEIRRSYPNRKSVLVSSTCSSITIVPPAFLVEEKELLPKSKQKFIYLTPLSVIRSELDEPGTSKGFKKQIRINAEDPSKIQNYLLRSKPPTDPLELIYCRTDDDRLSFIEVTKRSVNIDANSLMFYNLNEGLYISTYEYEFNQQIIIKWEPLKLVTWFRIDVLQPSGIDCEGGLTSTPDFFVGNPPTEKIMKFRITASNEGRGRAVVNIEPPCDTIRRWPGTCELKTMDQFDVKYTKTGDKIGSGAFGTVALVKNTMGNHFAAKFLKTKTQKKRANAMREFEVMKKLKHPKLIELIDAFTSRDSVIFVMDYLWGGELFDRIAEEEHIKEIDVVFYIRQILEGLEYLHDARIAHLDIKPENIICLNPNSRLIKLIDFGLARVLDDDHVTRAIYGTRDYVAPEVLNYDRLTVACDMWSLGVVTYMLLSGVMPFAGETWAQRSANITRARYNFDDSAFKDISEPAKCFITSLLVLNPDNRMDATLARTHHWITHGPPICARPHMKRTRENLKSYLATYRARWQHGNVMWRTAEYWLCVYPKVRRYRRRVFPNTL